MDACTLIGAPREIDSERVHLVSPRPEHAAAFLDSHTTSLPLLRYIAWGQALRDAGWAERFQREGAAMVEAGECLIFNALLRDDGAYVGRVDLHSFDFEAPRAEIGYVGDARLAGRGLMREAARAVIDLGFELGLARIHAISDARNERALRFAESLGLRCEGLLRAWERDPQGALADVVILAAYNPCAR
jgi:RimJ/RimL family protein N-acetyltransferase